LTLCRLGTLFGGRYLSATKSEPHISNDQTCTSIFPFNLNK
jgi:hypothetical protein